MTRARNLFRCRACGQTFTAYAPAERHVDQVHGGGRIEIVVLT